MILAGNESHDDDGRLANALEAAKEFAETDRDEPERIFDDAGTQWIPEREGEESDYYELYQAVRDDATVGDYCSGAFGVADREDAGLVTPDEHDGHPSIRSLVDDDYEIITFQTRPGHGHPLARFRTDRTSRSLDARRRRDESPTRADGCSRQNVKPRAGFEPALGGSAGRCV